MTRPTVRASARFLSPLAVLALGLGVDASARGASTTRASVSTPGVEGNASSFGASISADGRYVAFESNATNLVPGDTNGRTDVFVRDTWLGTTVRASVSAAGTQGGHDSFSPRISADGRHVAFLSRATNLALTDFDVNAVDVFVKDLDTGFIEQVSFGLTGLEQPTDCAHPDISADGRCVSFTSPSADLVLGDLNGVDDAFVHDRVTHLTERVSVDSLGQELALATTWASLSADGRKVAFQTGVASFLPFVTGITFAVRDLALAQTHLALDAAGMPYDALQPILSSDGTAVAFMTSVPYLPADTDLADDVYVVDLNSGALSLASGITVTAAAASPTSISADGRFVAFQTIESAVPADTNGAVSDVYVHDRMLGSTVLGSVSGAGTVGNGTSAGGALAADGSVLAFHSLAANLVPGDANAAYDVFVRRFCAPATTANYGAGHPGAGGVPVLASGPPVLGAPFFLLVGHDNAQPAPALLVIGAQPANLTLSSGAELLAEPSILVPFALPPGGIALPAPIPNAPDACGVHVFVQLLVADPTAPGGAAFSPGLALRLGF